ncbi:hypothetical protein BWI93_01115 [Siphonobacter sp. BAB-5385]|uniref:hypothetical protein n=1 Tax=Siphonobacter sp. BAB-5385 TaxID=1864822 RepID=UPI000B9EB656|nr:hypothetical protein [Siphonobacter sp. BAB-5385]OZI09971.1 hypothetical protein BWI93_01115 [Siphonobacter sp. BAB-5385]
MSTPNYWAVVELMGHAKIAGEVSEASGGMIRVDVPETPTDPSFTRIFNPSAIYCINPVSEDFARNAAELLKERPVHIYEAEAVLTKLIQTNPERVKRQLEKAGELSSTDGENAVMLKK